MNDKTLIQHIVLSSNETFNYGDPILPTDGKFCSVHFSEEDADKAFDAYAKDPSKIQEALSEHHKDHPFTGQLLVGKYLQQLVNYKTEFETRKVVQV